MPALSFDQPWFAVTLPAGLLMLLELCCPADAGGQQLCGRMSLCMEVGALRSAGSAQQQLVQQEPVA